MGGVTKMMGIDNAEDFIGSAMLPGNVAPFWRIWAEISIRPPVGWGSGGRPWAADSASWGCRSVAGWQPKKTTSRRTVSATRLDRTHASGWADTSVARFWGNCLRNRLSPTANSKDSVPPQALPLRANVAPTPSALITRRKPSACARRRRIGRR